MAYIVHWDEEGMAVGTAPDWCLKAALEAENRGIDWSSAGLLFFLFLSGLHSSQLDNVSTSRLGLNLLN